MSSQHLEDQQQQHFPCHLKCLDLEAVGVSKCGRGCVGGWVCVGVWMGEGHAIQYIHAGRGIYVFFKRKKMRVIECTHVACVCLENHVWTLQRYIFFFFFFFV